jgi:transposase
MSKISKREAAHRRAQAERAEAMRNRERLLYNRREAARLFGVSVETIIRLEGEGRLTGLKLSSSPNGKTFYRANEVLELAGIPEAV